MTGSWIRIVTMEVLKCELLNSIGYEKDTNQDAPRIWVYTTGKIWFLSAEIRRTLGQVNLDG